MKVEPKMYTCWMCGKPTPNYHEYSPSLAAIMGAQGRSWCDECERKIRIGYEWANEQVDDERLVCPYCERDIDDPWQYKDGEYETVCPNCGRTFRAEIGSVRTYRTRRRIEDMPDGWDGGEF